MIAWQDAQHLVAVAGRVTNAETGKTICGAEIVITGSPETFKQRLQGVSLQDGKSWITMTERPDRTRTRDDGLFYFLDLPSGDYAFTASLPSSGRRFGTAEGKVKVTRTDKGDTKLAFVDVSLQPTMVKGQVTGSGHKSGVVLAEVRVKGSGERAFTNAQGQYSVCGIQPGKRVLQVSAQGYRAESHPFTVSSPGASETVNVNLILESG
jgi:hypothetical protein